MPNVVRCPHENTAAHMAGGYALVTGRGQGVLVHVDVGTANTANAMHNMFRSRLPVLLMAGKAPYTANDELVGSRDTYVHFVQEPFDQGEPGAALPEMGMDAAVRRRGQGGAAARPLDHAERAARAGLSDDAARDADRSTGAPTRSAATPAEQFAAHAGGGADPKLVAALADRLLAAENPILITGYAGRNRACRAKRSTSWRSSPASPVFEANMTNNISHESPCFVGFSPDKQLPKADVGLLVDVDVPWFPSDVQAEREVVLGAHRRRHRSSPARRCGPSRATCACRATAAASSSRCSRS